MDIDFHSIIKRFTQEFILKECQDSVLLALGDPEKRALFINQINEDWKKLIDSRQIHLIDTSFQPDQIKKELNLTDYDLCYVISSNKQIDDKAMQVDYALEKIHGQGFGSILINLKADKIYLEINMTTGLSNRYIGTANNE